jgi:hypothetical protein
MRLSMALLSAASAFVVATGAASAADLPSAKAAPVEYVRICSVHGAGFFYIPGSDTCIKFSGRVRAEFGYFQPKGFYVPALDLEAVSPDVPFSPGFVYGRDVDATGYQANGRLNVDVRTSTEWGLLRAFFRYDFAVNSGVYTEDRINGKSDGTNAGLDKAFIQWAGLTAGRATSFFDFYANDLNFESIAGADHTVNLFAYTATFGSGFSATLSVEDRVDNQAGINWGIPVNTTSVIDGTSYYSSWPGVSEIAPGGTRMPDIVANLRVDQGWGSAQLSGAIHQVRYGSLTGDSVPVGFGTYLQGASNGFAPCYSGQTTGALCNVVPLDTDYGYAIQGGVKINLPMLAAGDQLWLQAAYANGATNYLGPANVSLFSANGYAPDAWVFPTYTSTGQFNGGVEAELTSGWNLTAAVLHYWTPTVRQALFGSYLNISNPDAVTYFSAFDGGKGSFTRYGAPDVTVWQVGSNVIWSPVADFDIGLEVGYINTDAGNVPTNFVTSGNNSYWNTSGSESQFYTRLRVERNF